MAIKKNNVISYSVHLLKHFVSQRSLVAGNVEAALTALIRSLGETFSSLVMCNC